MTLTTTTEPAHVAKAYFDAWTSNDMDSFRELLAEGVTFDGPLATSANADEAVAGMTKLAAMTERIDIRKRCVDAEDVITWFDLHLEGVEPMPVANWTRVENGKIVSIRVVFDPRPMLEGS
jgi:ketosteroid isomerase-like protein